MDRFDELKEAYTGKFDLKNALMGNLPGDPPLLEELGIDLSVIKSESLLPLKVLQQNPESIMVSSDLTGPVILLFIFTFSLVLQCKIHFGYIYLISLLSSFLMYVLLNLLSSSKIGYTMCCNVIGYSMTPVVGFSIANILLKWMSPFLRAVLGFLMSLWSGYTSSVVFCTYMKFNDKLVVVLYPLFLAYMCFTMMVVF